MDEDLVRRLHSTHAPQSLDERLAAGPPPLLPGRSARFWAETLAWEVFAVVILVAAMPVISFLAPTNEVARAFVNIDVVLQIGALLPSWGFTFWRMRVAERRELLAGYTTLGGQHPDDWKLDDRTGAVLRRPGGREERRRR